MSLLVWQQHIEGQSRRDICVLLRRVRLACRLLPQDDVEGQGRADGVRGSSFVCSSHRSVFFCLRHLHEGGCRKLVLATPLSGLRGDETSICGGFPDGVWRGAASRSEACIRGSGVTGAQQASETFCAWHLLGRGRGVVLLWQRFGAETFCSWRQHRHIWSRSHLVCQTLGTETSALVGGRVQAQRGVGLAVCLSWLWRPPAGNGGGGEAPVGLGTECLGLLEGHRSLDVLAEERPSGFRALGALWELDLEDAIRVCLLVGIGLRPIEA
mmetsp:Transcript_12992/g.30904  ORF Transcript_12992/g.30904 Transcript_12992/m.30904 type:complete len:269 (+) Transcript_12992:570-1376(+)